MSKIDDTVEQLRGLLFAQIRRLNLTDTKALPDEIKRANAMGHVAQTIINSAVVECTFMELTGSKGSGFMKITKHANIEEPVGTVTRISQSK